MNAPSVTWEHDDWVRQLLAVLPPARPEASGGPVARPGSLWASKATRRRARALWSSETHVCLQYNEGRSTITLSNAALLRLYMPV